MAEPRRLLLVEDEPVIAFALEDIVLDMGFEVVGPVYRLAEGLVAAAGEEFEGAILDVNLNEQTSYPIAAVLAERGIPFLFATGYAEGGIDWPGDAPVIAKPYSREQLAAALRLLFPA
ncbi:response regulator [Sphingomonas rosea]|jgi:DNA-binding response OmpR family regulator|uniref:Response regulator n=1 Tax=Sphingomonas rosea TaxID=335605 RepID=A0ABP7U218_9SPHN